MKILHCKPIIDVKKHWEKTQTNFEDPTLCKERRNHRRTFNAIFDYKKVHHYLNLQHL